MIGDGCGYGLEANYRVRLRLIAVKLFRAGLQFGSAWFENVVNAAAEDWDAMKSELDPCIGDGVPSGK